MGEKRCENCRFWKEPWVPGEMQKDQELLAKAADQLSITVEKVKERLDFIDKEKDHKGTCKRFPPTVVWDGDAYEARQPRTYAGDWCGEWQKLTPPAPA
jgi:hypothetical protein